MNTSSLNQVLQIVAWFVALVEFSAGLYILLLNIWHNANRHVSALLLLTAINTVAIGMLMTAATAEEARLPVIIQAMTTPAVTIGLLLVGVVLLKPDWLHGWRLWIWLPLYGVGLLTAILTLVDVRFGTQLWFMSPDPKTYVMGGLSLSQFAAGRIAMPLRVLSNYLAPVGALVFLLYVALFDKKVASPTRRLAWLLFGALAATSVAQFGLRGVLGPGGAALVTSVVYAVAYAYVGFQQMVSERRLQRGSLRVRLTLLVLSLTAPLLVAVTLFMSNQATVQIKADTYEQFRLANVALKNNIQLWLDQNTALVQQIAALPDIVSMDPGRQKPVLVATAQTHKYLALVQTTNFDGVNVARSDSGALQNYSDREWFQGAKGGFPVKIETLVGATGKPAVNLAAPIWDAAGHIVGASSIVNGVDDITDRVKASVIGKTGDAYVVDINGRVVAHSNPAFADELRDLSQYKPVAELRKGQRGHWDFSDEQGVSWHVYMDVLSSSGWGIIVQQRNSELSNTVQSFQRLAWISILVGTLVLSVMVGFMMRQAFQPIGMLTETATAIAAGDLMRTAPVESEDELGTLARAFNSMTEQLRGLIGSLEQRVANRTADLERRSRYLQASAEVGRAVASILETERLFQQVVELIRERFDLYYVGLFQVDDKGEWAMLRAGTGEAGREMLARGHRLQVGGDSMIGWSIANAQARIALEAGADAVRLATTELPDTRSEAALPLRSRGQVIGALTVQSSHPGAFDEAALAVLQIMADQVAVALDNARLFAESQAALEASRQAYGELSRKAWAEMLRLRQDWGYCYTSPSVAPAEGDWQPEMLQALQAGQSVQEDDQGELALAIPLKVRDQVIGVLDFRKDTSGRAWTDEEKVLLETLAEQLGVALESARLYQDTQRRAARERLTREITDNIRAATSVEDAMQRAVQEMSRVLGAEMVARIGTEQELLASVPENGDSNAPGGKA